MNLQESESYETTPNNQETSFGKSEKTSTVLLVDDDHAVRKVLSEILRLKDFKVFDTGNPIEALDFHQKHFNEISLVITDVVMPLMNGVELANLIQEKTPGTHFLFISGYSKKELTQNLPTNHTFMQKPFSLNEFVSKVTALMAPAHSFL